MPETTCSASRQPDFGCAGPRSSDDAALHRFCSLWDVARWTTRIPHPYPPGSAERFIYAARETNASGHDLTLVLAPKKGKRDVLGSISLESRGTDRLSLGFVVAPEYWNKGLATEAARAMVKAGFSLTPAIEILASASIENPASRRVLDKCGFRAGLDRAEGRAGARRVHREP